MPPPIMGTRRIPRCRAASFIHVTDRSLLVPMHHPQVWKRRQPSPGAACIHGLCEIRWTRHLDDVFRIIQQDRGYDDVCICGLAVLVLLSLGHRIHQHRRIEGNLHPISAVNERELVHILGPQPHFRLWRCSLSEVNLTCDLVTVLNEMYEVESSVLGPGFVKPKKIQALWIWKLKLAPLQKLQSDTPSGIGKTSGETIACIIWIGRIAGVSKIKSGYCIATTRLMLAENEGIACWH